MLPNFQGEKKNFILENPSFVNFLDTNEMKRYGFMKQNLFIFILFFVVGVNRVI